MVGRIWMESCAADAGTRVVEEVSPTVAVNLFCQMKVGTSEDFKLVLQRQ
jgi:hypothetical protein